MISVLLGLARPAPACISNNRGRDCKAKGGALIRPRSNGLPPPPLDTGHSLAAALASDLGPPLPAAPLQWPLCAAWLPSSSS